jgi:hypothetical protein
MWLLPQQRRRKSSIRYDVLPGRRAARIAAPPPPNAIANIPETTAPGILQATFAAMINATFSPRRNVPSDQLAPGGRRPGMAAPTLDTQGEAR